ncbi:aminotransferase class I/II-fold pyridoxal phosphate-dependent enzyme [Lachnospiraceae bacterium C1.1]|nr:aminotransferase class I/II-fold pyridoxal phosphate-dependent enzyme [Lachnospiraceae bacterium C1.1]
MHTNLSELLIFVNDSIRSSLIRINDNGKNTLFVIDDEKHLKGIITDGDIRRLLIDGVKLSQPISNYYNRNCVYGYYNSRKSELNKLFREGIHLVPLIDEEFKVVDYIEFQNDFHIPVAEPYLNGNEYRYLTDVLTSTWISSKGAYIDRFEKQFADYVGCQYGVATCNGTVALHLALTAMGISQGDEVIVPNLTFAATINSVLFCGATPVLVDVEEDSWCISTEEIRKAITSKTKAIVPVHIYGQPCNMETINEIARDNGLFVVEDCAEAHGAEFDGRKVGSIGDVGCFSFFGNKVITTGEGGICVTNDKNVYEKMKILRDHGMSKSKRYYHEVVGFNYRMTNMQAAIGCAQLEQIESILDWRRKLEDKYFEKMGTIPLVKLQNRSIDKTKKIPWLISILVPEEKRSFITEKLLYYGIETRDFFITLSDMKIYQKYKFSDTNSKKLSRCGINLPTNNKVDDNVIELITKIIREVIDSRG